MTDVSIMVFLDRQALHLAAAKFTQKVAQEAVEKRDRFLWVLSGGGTPGPIYDILVRPPFVDAMPWVNTMVFWGDERNVPADDPESNYGQARKVILDRVPIPAEGIYRIRGEMTKEEAAADYAGRLARIAAPGLAWPRFDLVFLGMGDDGHTASLFPGANQALESEAPVIGVTAFYDRRPANRVTLTPVVFNSARQILFLVSGERKAAALVKAVGESGDPGHIPVRRIRPVNGHVTWFVDRAAAKFLNQEI